MNSFFEAALKTKAAKEAYGAGILRLFQTRNLDSAVDTMFNEAEKNGALNIARISLGLDIVKAFWDSFKK